jgi:hypothetical protein
MIRLPHLLLALLGFMFGMFVGPIVILIEPRLWLPVIGLVVVAIIIVHGKVFPRKPSSSDVHRPTA